MSLQATISRFLGLVERAEKAIPAADVVAGLNSRIEILTKELSGANAQLAESVSALNASASRITALETENKSLKDGQSDFESRVEKAAAVKSVAIISAQGVKPVTAVITDTPGKEPAKKLFGLQRVKAAFKAERESHQNN